MLLIHSMTSGIYTDTLIPIPQLALRLVAVAYKTRIQPTVATSSTEAEYMTVCDAGEISLFVRNILYDLEVPQEAVIFLYEDNKGAIVMGNAQKPTT